VCHAKTTPVFDSENRRRFSTPIRTCSTSGSIFGSTWSIEKVVIGFSSLFSFGLFVNSAGSVNKHFDYSFFLFLLRFATILMHNCSSNRMVVTFFGHVCFRSRKSAPIFDPVCLQPKSRSLASIGRSGRGASFNHWSINTTRSINSSDAWLNAVERCATDSSAVRTSTAFRRHTTTQNYTRDMQWSSTA